MADLLDTLLGLVQARAREVQQDPLRETLTRSGLNLVAPGFGATAPASVVGLAGVGWDALQGGLNAARGVIAAPVLEQVARENAAGVRPADRASIVPPILDSLGVLHRDLQYHPQQAAELAQQRWERAPEAFPAEKFLVEAATDPTSYLAAGTGAALTRAGHGVRAAQAGTALQTPAAAIAKALEVLGAGATAYDEGARALVQGATGGAGAVLRHVPAPWAGKGATLGGPSGRALLNRSTEEVANDLARVQGSAQELGARLPAGQELRATTAGFNPPSLSLLTRQTLERTGTTDAAAAKQLANEYLQDIRHVDTALSNLGMQGRGRRPASLPEALERAQATAPAPAGAWQEAVQRYEAAFPGERLTMRSGAATDEDRFTRILDTVLLERNPPGQVFEERQRYTAWLQFLGDRYGPVADTLLPGQRNRAAEAVAHRLGGGVSSLPSSVRPTPWGTPPEPGSPLYTRLDALTDGRVADLGERFAPYVEEIDKTRGAVAAALDTLGLTGQTWEAVTTQTPQLVRAFDPKSAAGKAAATLNSAVARYRGLDPRDAGRESEALGAAFLQDRARQLGLETQGWSSRTWDSAQNIWRQQALLAPSYHVNNVADALLKSLLVLGHGGTVDLRGAFGRALQRTRAGADAPHGPVADLVLRQTGVPIRREIFAGTQAGKEFEARGLERAPGVGKWFTFNREFAQAVEESVRAGSYLHGYQQEAAQRFPSLVATLAQGDARLAQALRDAGPLLQPAQVDTLLQAAGRPAGDVTAAYRALGAYRTAASDAGVALANKLHFNYQDTTNLDEMLRKVTGFHFFATRNLPLYAEILATHPLMLRALNDYDEETERQAKAGGYERNKRLQDSVPVGGTPGQTLSRVFFGQDGLIFTNPLRYISITRPFFAAKDLLRGKADDTREMTAAGKVLKAGEDLGIGLTPLASIGLAPTGLFGAQQPRSLLRYEPLVESTIQATTGQRPEMPWDTYQRQRPWGGTPPADPNVAVRTRLAEMSLELFPDYARQHAQAPVHPVFVAAMLAGPQHPLWQEASRNLGSRSVTEGAISALGGQATFVPQAQVAVQAAQAGVPQANVDQVRPLDPVVPRANYRPGDRMITPAERERQLKERAARGQPEALLYQEALRGGLREQAGTSQSAALRQAILQDWATASPARRQALLQDPNVRNVLLAEQSERLLGRRR